MKKAFFRWALVMAGIFSTAIFLATAQQKQDASRDVTGGWLVCVDTTFSKNYTCDKPYTAFDFNNDGSYTEFRQSANPKTPGAIHTFKGKWKITKQALGLKENETPGKKTIGIVYDIHWTDKDHFYSEYSEGPLAKKIYMYFSRKQ